MVYPKKQKTASMGKYTKLDKLDTPVSCQMKELRTELYAGYREVNQTS